MHGINLFLKTNITNALHKACSESSPNRNKILKLCLTKREVLVSQYYRILVPGFRLGFRINILGLILWATAVFSMLIEIPS